jgi:ribosome-associated protein
LRIKASQKALVIAKAALEKKAENIVMLDMRKVSDITDYFVVCSATSSRGAKTIAENIIEKIEKRGGRVWHTEGYREALWILLDCGDVVAHIFRNDMRDFYNLEKLWADASQKYLN